jgi:hypothetical protein
MNSLMLVCWLLVGFWLESRVQIGFLRKKVSAISRLEAKLDLLLKDAGIAYDPMEDLPPGVMEAVRAGEKIRAIQCYRQATGAGLKEAKEFIEEVQARAGQAR